MPNMSTVTLTQLPAAWTSPDATKFFDTLNNVYTFLCSSEQHACFLDIQKEMQPDHRLLSNSRGCDARSTAVSKVFILYDIILEVLAEYADQSEIEAESLL